MRWCSLALLAAWLSAGSVHAQDAAACTALVREAEAAQAAGDYTDAAQRYVAMARDQAECGHGDLLLWNAAINYDSARLLGRAIQVRQALVNSFPRSPVAPRALFLIAADYHAMAVYDQAADYYASFAERYPASGDDCTAAQRESGTCADATVAIDNALLLYVGLGRRDRAQQLATLYARNYGARSPEHAATLAFGVGFDDDDPADTIARATELLRVHGAHTWLDQAAHAWLSLARAHLALDRPAEARAALAQVVGLVTPDALSALGTTDMDALVRDARAREALAEARFLLAEQEEIALAPTPRWSGAHTAAAIDAWWAGTFTRWRDRQLAAMAHAIAALAQTRDLNTPAWEIASYAREGDLRARILEAAAAVALPAWAEPSDALADAFDAARAAAIADVTDRVRASYAECAERALHVRWLSERSEHCEDALDALDPTRHGAVHELHGEASWVAEGIALPQPASRPAE